MVKDPRRTVMHVSLAVSLLMLAGKMTAWWLTGSTAFLADAAESVVHGVATGMAAFSLWLADRPADPSHPYGHGRIAYFSAGFEGALVLAAAGAVIWSGVHGLLYGTALTRLGDGLAIGAVLAAINLALGLALVRIGRKQNALILLANGQHVLSDMWTTVAALVGVLLVVITGVEWLDPVTALVIAMLIMVNGATLVLSSLGALMDRLDPTLRHRLFEALDAAIAAHAVEAYHQLRCRRVNDALWIDVHLLLSGEATVLDAHAEATRVEEAVAARFPEYRVHISSHLEPAEHEAGHPGGHVGRDEPFGERAARRESARESGTQESEADSSGT